MHFGVCDSLFLSLCEQEFQLFEDFFFSQKASGRFQLKSGYGLVMLSNKVKMCLLMRRGSNPDPSAFALTRESG